MKMYFDADEEVKVRRYGNTHLVSKNKLADFLTAEEDEDNLESSTASSLENTVMLGYLPCIMSITMTKENPNIITLSPIKVRMEISDKLAEFLVS